MNKKLIRLTEENLHRIVKRSVKNVLTEKVFDKVPWSDEDTERGREQDWQYYQSNPWGDFGEENLNIKDRKGKLGMAALSDDSTLQALGRNGATTSGKHSDAQQRHAKRQRERIKRFRSQLGLAEGDLHRIVNESINDVLKERQQPTIDDLPKCIRVDFDGLYGYEIVDVPLRLEEKNGEFVISYCHDGAQYGIATFRGKTEEEAIQKMFDFCKRYKIPKTPKKIFSRDDIAKMV